MKDTDKTHEQLIKELTQLRQRIAELEASKSKREQIEEEILVANERLQYLLSSTSAVIYTAKASGDYGATFISENVSQVVGYEPRKFLENSSFWIDHVHPDDVQGVLAEVSRIFEQKHYTYEYRFKRKDGTYIWVRDEMKLVQDIEEKPLEIIGYWVDITDRKHAEEALYKERDKAQQYLDIAEVMLVVLDKKGTITLLNRKGSQILGYKEGELIGKNWFTTCLPSHLRKKVNDVFKKLMAGELQQIEFYENPILTKAGTERIIAWHNTILKDRQGNLIGTLSSGEDITERKKAEEALRESETRFRTLFEAIPDCVLVHDDKGTILHINEIGAQQLEWSAKDLVGKNLREIMAPEQRVLIDDHIRETFKVGWCKFETTYVSRSGWQIAAEVNQHPIKFGKKKAILRVARDITERKRVEDSLKETGLFLRNILDSSSSISIISTDLEQNILFWNKGAEDIFGYKAEEVIGRHTVDILYPDEGDTKQIAEEIRSYILNKKRELRREIKEVTKDGRILWINLTSTPRFDENKNVIGILGIGEDITERKRIEEEKRASEKRYKTLFDSASDAVFIINMAGQFIDVNEVACKRSGYRKEELLKMTPMDIDHPEYASLVQKRIKMLRQQGHLFFETLQVRRDGTSIPTELSSRVIEYDGKPAILSIARDITDRKQIEEALRASEEQFRQFFENAPEYCYMISPEGVIFNVNNAALTALGYTKKELVGKPLQTIYAPESVPKMEQLYSKWKKTGQLQDEEMIIITKKGERRIVLISAGAIKDSNGKILHSVSVQKDITERKNMEEALRLSEERFRRVVETMEVGLGAIDENGVLTYVNEYLAKMVGYSIDEMIGRSTLDFYEEKSRKIQEKIFKKRRTGMRDSAPYEVTWRRKNGQKVYAILSPTPMFDADGHYTGSFAIHTDITKHKQIEEALRESEEKYRELINGMNDTAWVIGFDGKFIDVNDAAVETLGYSREELLAMGPHDIDSSLDAETITGLIKKMPTDKIQIFETNHTTKDGKLIPVEINSSLVTYQGKRAILSIARDITERKKVDESLREKDEMIRTFVETSQDWIWSIDVNAIHTYSNPAVENILGYTPDELIGKSSLTLIHDEDRKSIKAKLPQWIKGKSGWQNLILRWRHKNGQWRWLESNAVPIFDEIGKVIGFRGVDRDITDRKQSEEALHHSYQQMQEMLGSTVNALASTVEMKDQYTAGHQPRVTQLACAIAEEMGLAEEQIEGIQMAGLIHDIGKIMVPAEILNKPGPLTEMQYEMIKMHPQASFDILKGIRFPWPVAEIVLQHHERMDGSGYPQGLSGEEILLEARILAVANVVEAMTSHRPYRAAHDIKEPLAEISKNKGILYDPAVVDACLKLFREKRFTFKQVQ